MKRLELKFGVSLALIIGLAACGDPSKNNATAVRTKGNADGSKTGKDTAKVDADKAAAEAARLAEGETDVVVKLGGQPGSITLRGILVKKEGELKSVDASKHVTVSQKGGKGSDLKEADVRQNALILEDVMNMDTLNSISTKDVIKVGCQAEDLATLPIEAGLTDKAFTVVATEQVQSLVANTIVLCGPKALGDKMLSITAQTLILVKFSHEFVGAGALAISAKKLVLVGENNLATKGLNDLTEGKSAPQIDLGTSTEVVSQNDGKLFVESVGGDVGVTLPVDPTASENTDDEAAGE